MQRGRPPVRSSVANWDAVATAPSAITAARSPALWCWASPNVPSAGVELSQLMAGQRRHSNLPNIQANDRQLRDVTCDSPTAAQRKFTNPPSIFVRAGKPVCIYKEGERPSASLLEAVDGTLRNR